MLRYFLERLRHVIAEVLSKLDLAEQKQFLKYVVDYANDLDDKIVITAQGYCSKCFCSVEVPHGLQGPHLCGTCKPSQMLILEAIETKRKYTTDNRDAVITAICELEWLRCDVEGLQNDNPVPFDSEQTNILARIDTIATLLKEIKL